MADRYGTATVRVPTTGKHLIRVELVAGHLGEVLLHSGLEEGGRLAARPNQVDKNDYLLITKLPVRNHPIIQ